ncbi:hypothetical protein M2280_005906 [Prescottella agglutinans]|uniref:Uncharacterized protein n=1 Tax=Prescottella agglutinans TaxID=1644129 RepID=A0ABT6ML79_9NOCA|nr:hypothetical protein [Prescottella agglutinans]
MPRHSPKDAGAHPFQHRPAPRRGHGDRPPGHAAADRQREVRGFPLQDPHTSRLSTSTSPPGCRNVVVPTELPGYASPLTVDTCVHLIESSRRRQRIKHSKGNVVQAIPQSGPPFTGPADECCRIRASIRHLAATLGRPAVDAVQRPWQTRSRAGRRGGGRRARGRGEPPGGRDGRHRRRHPPHRRSPVVWADLAAAGIEHIGVRLAMPSAGWIRRCCRRERAGLHCSSRSRRWRTRRRRNQLPVRT